MRRLPADLITAGLILVVAAVLGVTLIWSYGPQTDAAGQATHHLSMAEQWFITDTHLGHPFMATFRGFPSIEAHDAAIDHAVRKSVRDGDHLFVLGDVAMGGRAHGLAMIADWPGIKHLIAGNHDRCHPMNGNSHMHQREYLAAFDSVQTGGMIKRDGMRILLSHFPYDGEGDMRAEHDDRAGQWRLQDEGNPLIHGHVHDSTRVRLSKNGTTMIHAGLDAWDFKPVTIHTLLSEAGLT